MRININSTHVLNLEDRENYLNKVKNHLKKYDVAFFDTINATTRFIHKKLKQKSLKELGELLKAKKFLKIGACLLKVLDFSIISKKLNH